MSEEEVEIFVFIVIGGGGRNIFFRNQNWVILKVDLFFRTKTGLQKLLMCLTFLIFLGLRMADCENTSCLRNISRKPLFLGFGI